MRILQKCEIFKELKHLAFQDEFHDPFQNPLLEFQYLGRLRFKTEIYTYNSEFLIRKKELFSYLDFNIE